MASDDLANWKALSENMRDGLVVVDESGSIRFTNPAAAHLLQRTREELVGRPFGYPATTDQNATVNLLARDGSMLTAHLRSAPIQWENAPGWVVVIHDITELLAKQRQIEELNQKLANQVTDLEQFSYMIAHDLRAPVRAICGFAHVVAEEHRTALSPAGALLIEQIQDRCDAMERLIEGVLSFARSSVRPLQMGTVDLNDLIKEIVIGLDQSSNGVAATVQIDPLPKVRGDGQLLAQVFVNLLSNAVKYGNAQNPKIHIYSTATGDRCRISVADNGPGFSETDAERIFDPFTRLNPGQREGSGVGLSIVRNIVLRHGGKVWASGKKGEGATFHVELPSAALSMPDS